MRDKLVAAYDYCRALTKREARNFYYGFMLLPLEQRRAIYAAYAFARECDDIVDGDLPADESARRLDVQRRRLDDCLAGEPAGPVFEALGDAVARYAYRAYLYELMDGVQMDLEVRATPICC